MNKCHKFFFIRALLEGSCMFFVVCVCVCVFLAASMACRILVPHPLQWNLRVLKAGPPGKSLLSFVVDIFSCSGKKTKWKRLKKKLLLLYG